MSKPPDDAAQYLANLFAAHPADAFKASLASLAELQQDYLKQIGSFWQGVLGVASPAESADGSLPKDDKRFSGDAWRSIPGLDQLTGHYLSYCNVLQEYVDTAAVDEKVKGQMRFALRQLNDAVSPANFFATNPEAMKLAVETGGQSVADGLSLFFKDLAKGRISMCDDAAFEVGKNLAVTAGAVIFENELIQVIQYAPRTARVGTRPLVVIPPAINKFYILDLQPQNSFVRYAVEQGQTVFLVSWRNVTPDLGQLTWDDYLEKGVMRAIDAALEVSGADQVNSLGFCVGGTLLACALAVMKARGDDKVTSLTLLTSMLDFSDSGEIGLLVSEQSVASRESSIGRGGLLQGKELALVFSSLRANDLIWPYVVNSYLKGKGPPAFDLLHWNSDGTNLPGPMFCWYVRNTYLENNFKEPGKTTQCGVPVDLSTVNVPAYLYASREDHIVPWRSAYNSTQLLGGKSTFVLGASGHIAGVINPPANKKRNYWSDGLPGASAESWLSTARSVPGSWWPHWMTWLKSWGGSEVPAREVLGNEKYRVIEPAPGRYVKAT